MTGTTDDQQLLRREHSDGEPLTEYDSKIVMLRAERHDVVEIQEVATELVPNVNVPEQFKVERRTSTYFGPKLLLEAAGRNYLLTAPGPETQLLLWTAETGPDGFRKKWSKTAEVTAKFADERPQYDLCPVCGEPMQTLEHEREAAFGTCPNAEL